MQRKKPANPLPGKAIKGEARRILFEFIEGEPLTKIRSDPNRRVELEVIYAELRQGFVADCFLANRDVLGADFDNILVTAGGEVYRIDQGGCLEYRAQGELKSDFGDEVLELQTMRDPALNPNTAAVFSPITEEELRLQIQEIYAKKEEILALPMPPLLKQRLENRLQFLVEYASGPTLRL